MIPKKLQGQVRRVLVAATACSLVLAGSAQPAHAFIPGIPGPELALMVQQLVQLRTQVRTSAQQLRMARQQVEGLRSFRLPSVRSMARSFLNQPVPPLGQGNSPLDKLFNNHVPRSLRGSMGIATPNEFARNLQRASYDAIVKHASRNQTVDQSTTGNLDQLGRNCEAAKKVSQIDQCSAESAVVAAGIQNEIRVHVRDNAQIAGAKAANDLYRERRADSVALAQLAQYRRDMERVQWYWQQVARNTPRQPTNKAIKYQTVEQAMRPKAVERADTRPMRFDPLPAHLRDDPTEITDRAGKGGRGTGVTRPKVHPKVPSTPRVPVWGRPLPTGEPILERPSVPAAGGTTRRSRPEAPVEENAGRSRREREVVHEHQ